MADYEIRCAAHLLSCRAHPSSGLLSCCTARRCHPVGCLCATQEASASPPVVRRRGTVSEEGNTGCLLHCCWLLLKLLGWVTPGCCHFKKWREDHERQRSPLSLHPTGLHPVSLSMLTSLAQIQALCVFPLQFSSFPGLRKNMPSRTV